MVCLHVAHHVTIARACSVFYQRQNSQTLALAFPHSVEQNPYQISMRGACTCSGKTADMEIVTLQRASLYLVLIDLSLLMYRTEVFYARLLDQF